MVFFSSHLQMPDSDFIMPTRLHVITSPGVIAAAVDVSDRVGHIMNYGDGWYSGAIYSEQSIRMDIRLIFFSQSEDSA